MTKLTKQSKTKFQQSKKLKRITFLYEDKELFISGEEAQKFIKIVTEAKLNGEYKKLNWRKVDLVFKKEVLGVVLYFSEVTGKKIKSDPVTASTAKPIRARLKEGYTVEQLKAVIDIKSSQWKNDFKMKQYLRPVTLFSDKFESYLIEGGERKQSKAERELESLRK